MLRHVEGKPEYDLYGENTYFREATTSLVQGLVGVGKWFSFGKGLEGQVNLLKVKNNKGVCVNDYLSDLYPETPYRAGVYKYLISEYLCYCEKPVVNMRYKTKFNSVNAYDRFLITANINVIGCWLGIGVEEAEAKYRKQLGNPKEDSCDPYFRYVKLYLTKEGQPKVSCPRTPIDLSTLDLRVYPLYALETGVETLYKMLSKGTYNVTFIKDSHQPRVINLTTNIDILKQYYPEDYLNMYFYDSFDGDFICNPYLCRGYIKAFEVGASRFDVPTRSVSYARITSIEKAEPDLSYVNIDLSSVISSFNDYLSTQDIDLNGLVEMLSAFGVGVEEPKNPTVIGIGTWEENQKMLLGTDFERQLAIFMLGNPQWFPNYTGSPEETVTDFTSLAMDTLDFTF